MSRFLNRSMTALMHCMDVKASKGYGKLKLLSPGQNLDFNP